MTVKWQSRPFEKCIERVRLPAKVPRKLFQPEGPCPIVSQEQDLINGYWSDDADVLQIDRPVVVFGDHTTTLKYVDFDFVVGADGVKVLCPKPFLHPRFFYYYLLAFPVEKLGYARHYRLLRELDVQFPEEVAEQKRIVAILDEAFARIDAAVANVERNLANAREVFESYLKTVLTKKGEGWEEKPLGTIAENLDRMRVPITKSKRTKGSIPYYGASGIVDFVADYLFDEDLLLVSEDGANLLARTYPIAFSIAGKAWVNNHAHVLRFADLRTQRFTEYYLNAISLQPHVSGMAQPKLNQKALNSIPVPLPPPEQCSQIVNGLDQMSGETDRLASTYRTKAETCAELRQSILQKAFSGELTAKEAEKDMAAA